MKLRTTFHQILKTWKPHYWNRLRSIRTKLFLTKILSELIRFLLPDSNKSIQAKRTEVPSRLRIS